MKKYRKDWIFWGHYALAAALLVAMIFSFFAFARENRTRILNQNREYAQDAALQTAEQVEEMLQARLTSLDLMSIAVSERITQPRVEQDLLEVLQDTSVFDYVEFIDADGLNHNADGAVSDATDRENYLKGMQGESGYHVIFNSRITHETLINFYTPIAYQGEIIGVLNGMFREESLRQALAIQFFGVDAPGMICLEDGTVIAACGWNDPPENLLDSLAGDGAVSEETWAAVRDALSRHEALSCTMAGSVGETSVSLVPVGENWTLVQALPSTVSREMESNANGAGIRLELRLAVLFLMYVAFLIVAGLYRRRRLSSEKARLGRIVEALVPLFTRLVVLDADPAGYEYLKGAPSGLSAKGSLEELVHFMSAHYFPDEEDRSIFLSHAVEEIQDALAADVPYLQYEYRIRWDGEDRWENVSVLCLRKKNGVPVSVIFAVQDVTAAQNQKDAVQQALRDAFRTAEDLSRAKSDFLARMSHDMRTPMNAVLGMTSVALSHLDDESRVQDCLEKIDTAGHRLLRLINDLLDMSKIESGGIVLKEEPFDLEDTILAVLDGVLAGALAKGLCPETDLSLTHRAVRGDPERLGQALRNILENAVKYTPPGGAVAFRARELPSRAPGSGYYEFTVEDTGAGIDPELQGKIFEPFVREKSDKSELGAGLGLPIARTIVKLMNGDIRVESEPGRGSRFTVHVFLKWEDPAAIPERPAPPEPEVPPGAEDVTRHAGVRVLLVEDNELNREIAQVLLEGAGVLVETAENGAQAAELARESPPSYYDLIFMDLQMPVMDGFAAARAIRSSGREDLERVPIVAVSANAFQEDTSRARDAGMNDLVMKPVDLDKLLAAMDQWLRKD